MKVSEKIIQDIESDMYPDQKTLKLDDIIHIIEHHCNELEAKTPAEPAAALPPDKKLTGENDVQVEMRKSKLEYAKKCGCERCKEIVAESAAALPVNGVGIKTLQKIASDLYPLNQTFAKNELQISRQIAWIAGYNAAPLPVHGYTKKQMEDCWEAAINYERDSHFGPVPTRSPNKETFTASLPDAVLPNQPGHSSS